MAIDPARPAEGRPGAVDRVLANVRHAAVADGRSFFVMYDIAGANAEAWGFRHQRSYSPGCCGAANRNNIAFQFGALVSYWIGIRHHALRGLEHSPNIR